MVEVNVQQPFTNKFYRALKLKTILHPSYSYLAPYDFHSLHFGNDLIIKIFNDPMCMVTH